jgi:hypothetical protein
MVLVGGLLVLLSLTHLAIPLLCFSFQCFILLLLGSMLLSRVRLHQLPLPVLSLAEISFSSHIRLVRDLHLRLLERLR